MNLSSKNIPRVLVSLLLDRSQLTGVVARERGGELVVEQSLEATLPIDSNSSDPELLGQAIRTALEKAEIREKRCAVSLALDGCLVLHTRLPDLSPEDAESFLALEIERALPYPLESARTASSQALIAPGERLATTVSLPAERVNALERAFELAGLKVLSITPALTALQHAHPRGSDTSLIFRFTANRTEIMITSGEGIVVLRSLDGLSPSGESDDPQAIEHLLRELRITLGQLPPAVRAALRQSRALQFGAAEGPWKQALGERLASMGLPLEWALTYHPGECALQTNKATPVRPEVSHAASLLAARRPRFELVLPRLSAAARWKARFSSRTLQWVGWALAIPACFLVAAFGLLQWKLSNLERRWKSLAPQVSRVEADQKQIRLYRAWFDESQRSLAILKALTTAFPDDGSVTAKSVEVRSLSQVTCTGTASNPQSLYKTMDQLRLRPEIAAMKVDQLQGQSPLQFSLNFQWGANKPE